MWLHFLLRTLVLYSTAALPGIMVHPNERRLVGEVWALFPGNHMPVQPSSSEEAGLGGSLSGVNPQISSSCHKSLSYPLLGAERDDTGVWHYTRRGLAM